MLFKYNEFVWINLTLPFQLVITVDKAGEQSAGGPPYLSLEIRALRADLIVHTWDVKAQVKLGFIQLLDNHWKGISPIA